MSDHEQEQTAEPEGRELSDDELDEVAGGSIIDMKPEFGQ